MAELRNRSPLERFESWVQTARAMPRLEVGSPLGGLWNDAKASVPLPSDVVGAVRSIKDTRQHISGIQTRNVPGAVARNTTNISPTGLYLRWLANRFGKPYVVDVQLPRD